MGTVDPTKLPSTYGGCSGMQKENQGTAGGFHRLALELYGRKDWQNVAYCFEAVIALDSPNIKDATACIEALAKIRVIAW